jgi:hypothetical protein
MSNIVSVLETIANDATLTDLEALKQYVSETNITELQKQAIKEHSISGLYATIQNIEKLKAWSQVAPEEEKEEDRDDEQESETEAINARLASNS